MYWAKLDGLIGGKLRGSAMIPLCAGTRPRKPRRMSRAAAQAQVYRTARMAQRRRAAGADRACALSYTLAYGRSAAA